MLMSDPLLITTFTTWKSTQQSNSSDDLIAALLHHKRLPMTAHLLRQLPVHFRLAPQQVITTVEIIRPAAVICCGMAEKRSHLTVEIQGHFQGETFYTSVDLQALVRRLPHTTISDNAGRFVCNYLYYRLLKYLRSRDSSIPCIFVHVPILTEENRSHIMHDFDHLLQQISRMHTTVYH